MFKKSLLIATLSLTGLAHAEADVKFTGFLTGTNNFMYRGLSLSDNGAAMQGKVTAEMDNGLYASLWGSNTTLRAGNGSGAGIEGNLFVGYKKAIDEDWSYDVGFLRTFYPGMDSGRPAAINGGARRDFNDFYGTLNFKGFSAGVSYSDDFFAETGSALYTFAGYNGEIIDKFKLTALVGYTRNSSKEFLGLFGVNKSGWAHYILGVSHPLPYNFEVSGAYHGTNGTGTDAFDVQGFGTNRFVFSLTKNF